MKQHLNNSWSPHCCVSGMLHQVSRHIIFLLANEPYKTLGIKLRKERQLNLDWLLKAAKCVCAKLWPSLPKLLQHPACSEQGWDTHIRGARGGVPKPGEASQNKKLPKVLHRKIPSAGSLTRGPQVSPVLWIILSNSFPAHSLLVAFIQSLGHWGQMNPQHAFVDVQ